MKNNRRFPRRPAVESLSLTVLSSDQLAAPGERIYCESVDISPVGLQVMIDRLIPQDNKVEIWMVMLDSRQTLHLHGRVSWVGGPRKNDHGPFAVGIELLPVADSDFARWLTLFEDD